MLTVIVVVWVVVPLVAVTVIV
jgi:hypothetical protein